MSVASVSAVISDNDSSIYLNSDSNSNIEIREFSNLNNLNNDNSEYNNNLTNTNIDNLGNVENEIIINDETYSEYFKTHGELINPISSDKILIVENLTNKRLLFKQFIHVEGRNGT